MFPTWKVLLIHAWPIFRVVKLLAKFIISIFIWREYSRRVSRAATAQAKRGLIEHINKTIDGWRAWYRRLSRLLSTWRRHLIVVGRTRVGYRTAQNSRRVNCAFVMRRIAMIRLIIVRWWIWIVKANKRIKSKF